MKTQSYAVLLAAPTDEDPEATEEVEVRVIYGDQLRAELEAPRHGIGSLSDAPMHFTALWIWASLTRDGKTSAPFQEFKRQLLMVQPVEEKPDEEPDPPTQPGASTGSG